MTKRRPRRPLSASAAAPAAALALALVPVLDAPASAVDSLSIAHHPVRCVVAGRYPQLDACFEPASLVARARVYFKGEGGPDWYYVEMKPEATCYRGILPRPKKSLGRLRYYVAVTDRDFAESRTGEYAAEVVTDKDSCAIGGVAPYVTTSTVLVSGAAALPAGFAGAGLLTASTAAVAAAVVGAGAAGAVVAGGGGAEPATPTTTRPPSRTTTTTTTVPPGPSPTTTTTSTSTTSTSTSTTTSTTTTTLPSGCAADSAPPDVVIVSPRRNDDVGAVVGIVVDAYDPGPVDNGIREVVLAAAEQGGRRTAQIGTVPGPGPRFEVSWQVPPCQGPGDRWYIDATAFDGCGRSTRARVSVQRRGSSCSAAAAAAARAAGAPALAWTSDLAVAGGRGQVVANGVDVVFPGPGGSELALPARAGRNTVEALLVEGGGAGTWRFTLASGAIRPGSLRVVAGDAVAVGPETVAFRLRGRPGERAVFEFEVD